MLKQMPVGGADGPGMDARAGSRTALEADYRRNGFVVVPGVLDEAALGQIRAEATAICRGRMGQVDGTVPARLEEADADVLRRYLCIHFPHKISPVMLATARRPAVVRVLTRLIGPNVKMMQSMLFIKSEGKPGQAWHQDEAHIPTRDRSLTAVWIALDAATAENGCLWVIPGSHRSGVLYPVRDQDDGRFDCTQEAYGFRLGDSDAIPIELPAGDAVVLDGYLLHRSLPNTGRHGMRRALVNHYMSAESLLPWFAPPPGAAMALHDHRDIELIAGTDPYSHSGTADLMRPHVRPDGQGGCAR
jgi:phytanoyl-CoA hydroxylase